MTPELAEGVGPDRRNNIGFLRVILASLVILSHSPELLDGDRHRELLTNIFGTISFGEFAVNFFFVLSGYLIVRSWLSKPFLNAFLDRRIRRIYPGFIAASLISVVILAPLAADHRVSIVRVLDQAIPRLATLTVPSYPGGLNFRNHAIINGATWTIQYEFLCYLLALGMGMLGLSQRKWPWLVIFVTSAAVMVTKDMAGIGGDGDPRVAMFRFVACFSAGAIFTVYREQIRLDDRWALACGGAVFLLMFLGPVAQLAQITFGAYVLFAFAFAKSDRMQRVGSRNDISYGLYLYAWPIQQLLIFYFPGISLPLHFLISLLLSAGAGYLSWNYVEKRWIQPPISAPGSATSLST